MGLTSDGEIMGLNGRYPQMALRCMMAAGGLRRGLPHASDPKGDAGGVPCVWEGSDGVEGGVDRSKPRRRSSPKRSRRDRQYRLMPHSRVDPECARGFL